MVLGDLTQGQDCVGPDGITPPRCTRMRLQVPRILAGNCVMYTRPALLWHCCPNTGRPEGVSSLEGPVVPGPEWVGPGAA